MNKDDEVYAPDGVPAGQIIRRPAAPDQASSANAEDRPGEAADHAGPASRGDTPTVAADRLSAANDRPPSGRSVVGERPTTVTETVTITSGRATTYDLTVGQQPTVVADDLSVANDSGPSRTSVVAQQATVELRSRLRAALDRHIDPDDDTMPALWRGGFIWLSVDSVLDGLVCAVGREQLAAERDQAAAAVERVRAECAAIGTPHICNAVDRILAVLDQPQEAP